MHIKRQCLAWLAVLFVPCITAQASSSDTRVLQSSNSGTGRIVGLQVDPVSFDTTYLATLHDLYVYPRPKFKNKKQERFYWRTVRDVKKTLPYAKLLAAEIDRTSELMSHMTRRQQKKYWKQYEKLLFARYEGDFRNMTASQGQMLMLLVDRECDQTSYDVIKLFRGSLTANFWQGIAKLFGNDLKAEYDGNDKDAIVERIITLVEAGQL